MLLPKTPAPACPPPADQGWGLDSKSYPGRLGLSTRWRDPSPLVVRRDAPEKGTARCVVKDPRQWLETLYDCCRLGNPPNPAVDFVLDGIDELLRERRLEVCNQVLMLADVDRLSIRAMLALLMETYRAKGKLDSRPRFYKCVEGYLQRVVPEQAALNLAGLE